MIFSFSASLIPRSAFRTMDKRSNPCCAALKASMRLCSKSPTESEFLAITYLHPACTCAFQLLGQSTTSLTLDLLWSRNAPPEVGTPFGSNKGIPSSEDIFYPEHMLLLNCAFRYPPQ